MLPLRLLLVVNEQLVQGKRDRTSFPTYAEAATLTKGLGTRISSTYSPAGGGTRIGWIYGEKAGTSTGKRAYSLPGWGKTYDDTH